MQPCDMCRKLSRQLTGQPRQLLPARRQCLLPSKTSPATSESLLLTCRHAHPLKVFELNLCLEVAETEPVMFGPWAMA